MKGHAKRRLSVVALGACIVLVCLMIFGLLIPAVHGLAARTIYVKVLSPTAGQRLEIGKTADIRFYIRRPERHRVTLRLTRDEGKTWETIVERSRIPGQLHSWRITGPPSDSCFVMVEDCEIGQRHRSGVFAIQSSRQEQDGHNPRVQSSAAGRSDGRDDG